MAWNGYRRKIFASKSLQFSYTGLQWCTLFPKNFAITFIHFIYICKAIKNIIISEFSLFCKQLTRPPEAGAADEAPRFQGMSRVPFLKMKNPQVLLVAFRSSCPDMFCRRGVLRDFAKFTKIHLCRSLFSKKLQASGNYFCS